MVSDKPSLPPVRAHSTATMFVEPTYFTGTLKRRSTWSWVLNDEGGRGGRGREGRERERERMYDMLTAHKLIREIFTVMKPNNYIHVTAPLSKHKFSEVWTT